MVLKTISPGCGVQEFLMLFFHVEHPIGSVESSFIRMSDMSRRNFQYLNLSVPAVDPVIVPLKSSMVPMNISFVLMIIEYSTDQIELLILCIDFFLFTLKFYFTLCFNMNKIKIIQGWMLTFLTTYR